ncbi:MAG: aspartate-ammonia lyase [Bacteroidia bacterium]
MKNTYNLTGNAGEYFVCSELSKLNILPLITPKNNPLFDIIATNSDGSKHVAIQVKTMGLENEQGWKLNKQITIKKNNPNLFLALVNLKMNAPNEFYIFRYDDFVKKVSKVYKDYIEEPHKRSGLEKKEVGFRWFDYKNFTQADLVRKNDWSLILKELK